MTQEKILDKIKKLLNKAESAKQIGSIHEAEIFMQKVDELMREYNISQAQLMRERAKSDDKFADMIQGEQVKYNKNQWGGALWQLNLASVISEHSLTYMYVQPRNGTMVFNGNVERVEMAIWLYNFLSTQITAMAHAAWKHEHEVKGVPEKGNRGKFYGGYYTGVILALQLKLKERADARRQTETKETQDMLNGLVIANKSLIKEFISQAVGINLKSHSMPRRTISNTARDKGFQDGKGLSLGDRLGNSSNNQKRLN